MLNFLLPEVFDNADLFDEFFSVTGNKDMQDDVIKRLHRILRPFLLRRLKNDVEKSLLPKKVMELYIGLSQMQRFWYTKLLAKDIETLNSLQGAAKGRLSNLLMQLRKVSYNKRIPKIFVVVFHFSSRYCFCYKQTTNKSFFFLILTIFNFNLFFFFFLFFFSFFFFSK